MPGTLFVLGSYVSALTLRVDRHPVPGETLIGRDFNWGPGGKGFNQAVAAARLGGDVHLAVAVGHDVFAELAIDVLRHEPIRSTELVRPQDAHSGVGFVTLTPSGENTIVLDPGANAWMSPDKVREMTAKIASASMFLTQQELPADAVEAGLAIARAHDVRLLARHPARDDAARRRPARVPRRRATSCADARVLCDGRDRPADDRGAHAARSGRVGEGRAYDPGQSADHIDPSPHAAVLRGCPCPC